VELLHLDWQPNYSCNDSAREEFARRLRSGLVEKLTFQDAVIFHGRAGFSSIRVYLRSSTRFTVIRIHFVGGRLVADIDCDGPSRSVPSLLGNLNDHRPTAQPERASAC
jgi:hypothetical protein